MIACLLLAGITVLTVPFVQNLAQFISAQVALGIFSSGLDVAGNAWLLELWEDKVNVPMQGMHFAFAIGMTIAPLIATPFLSKDIRKAPKFDNSTLNELNMTSGEHVDCIEGKTESHIAIPYAITAAALMFSGVLLFFVSLTVPYTQQSRRSSTSDKKQLDMEASESSSSSDEISSGSRYLHPKYLIILSSLILCFFTGVEINSFSFLPDFAVYSKLNLSKKTGALMTSVLSGSFALFRGLNIIVATKFSSEVMLYSHFALTCLGTAVMLPAALIDKVNLRVILMWVSVVISGAGYSCMFPTIYAYLEERITVNTFMTGATIFAGSVSTIVTPIIVGLTIEAFPLIFVYVSVVGLAVCFFFFVGLFTVERSHRQNYLTD